MQPFKDQLISKGLFDVIVSTKKNNEIFVRISALPPVDLHWFFEISISAIISNWDKNSVIN